MKRRSIIAGLGMAFFFIGGAPGQDTPNSDPKSLIGSWKLVSATYDGHDHPAGKIVEIKHVTDSQFTWFRYNPENNKITEAAGGPYSVKGDVYSEKIVYGLGKDYEMIRGHEIPLHWKLEAAKWHITGRLNNGLSIDEVWEKLGPGQ